MMAESPGTLLRSTLSNKESLVPLVYELDLVHAYITIQKSVLKSVSRMPSAMTWRR